MNADNFRFCGPIYFSFHFFINFLYARFFGPLSAKKRNNCSRNYFTPMQFMPKIPALLDNVPTLKGVSALRLKILEVKNELMSKRVTYSANLSFLPNKSLTTFPHLNQKMLRMNATNKSCRQLLESFVNTIR